MNRTKELTLISLLAVLIAISGSIKLPGPLPGTEFQLSAPIAVAIAASFGFRRYISAGIVASSINFLLGTHTIINVLIAMVFRIVAGGIIHFFRPKPLVVVIAGPLGTIAGRIVLGWLFKTPISVMLMASLPGMIYTALSAWPLSRVFNKIKYYTPWSEISYEGRII
ncbi:MAG: hypothetical protein AB2421_16540 [Thermotaleaceae bacterium]